MKKITMGLLLSLISITSFACHFYDDSYICGNTVYMHGEFSANSKFQFRFYGTDTTIIKEFETGDNVVDSTLKFQIPAGTTDVKLQFHNYYVYDNTTYNNWAGNYGADDYFEVDSISKACGTLGVTISNLGVTKPNNGTINVSFNAANETGIDHYDILASTDQNKWYKIGEVTPTGASNYNASITLAGVFAFILPLLGFYNKKRKWLSLALFAGIVILFSCNKVKDTGTIQPYKFIKVATISNTGAAPSYSETTPIK